MQSSSLAQAKKHIKIAIELKRIARQTHPDWSVYLATYTAVQLYQDTELETGEEFWSIRGYSDRPSRATRIKDPDAVIVQKGAVRFAVEIKWGAIEETTATDVPLGQVEWVGLASRLHRLAACRVRGPAVRAGRRYSSAAFPEAREYPVLADCQPLLVADFRAMHSLLPESYEEMLRAWKLAESKPRLADIGNGTDHILAVREVLSG